MTVEELLKVLAPPYFKLPGKRTVIKVEYDDSDDWVFASFTDGKKTWISIF